MVKLHLPRSYNPLTFVISGYFSVYKITKSNIHSGVCLSFDLRASGSKPHRVYKYIFNGKNLITPLENIPRCFKFQEAPHPSGCTHCLCVRLTKHKPISVLARRFPQLGWPWFFCFCLLCLQCHFVVEPLHRNALHLRLRYRDVYLKTSIPLHLDLTALIVSHIHLVRDVKHEQAKMSSPKLYIPHLTMN